LGLGLLEGRAGCVPTGHPFENVAETGEPFALPARARPIVDRGVVPYEMTRPSQFSGLLVLSAIITAGQLPRKIWTVDTIRPIGPLS
jgi:hypothetical protein